MADDATTKATIEAAVDALAPQAPPAAHLPYVDQLRRLQRTLMDLLQQSADMAEEPPAEQQQAVLHALGQLDPHADDRYLGHGERLRRLLAAVDIELSKWSSAMVQPPGPSGAAAVPEPAPAPVE